MTRKNRRDPLLPEHDVIWADPAHWTRASRRGAGYHKPVGLALMAGGRREADLPRYVRRNYMKTLTGPETPNRRMRKRIARLTRILKPLGLLLAGR